MNKNIYQRPSTKVVELHQTTHLLTGSGGVEATRKGYGKATSTNWDTSEAAVKSNNNSVVWE